MTEERLAEQSLEVLLTRVATETSGPAAGSAAAITAGMSAALVAKVARCSTRHLTDADMVITGADALHARALGLAEADAAAVSAMITQRSAKRRPEPNPTTDNMGTQSPAGYDARASAGSKPGDPTEIPHEIAGVAAQARELAERMTASANPLLLADAVAAQRLAEAAGAVCDTILESNQSLG